MLAPNILNFSLFVLDDCGDLTRLNLFVYISTFGHQSATRCLNFLKRTIKKCAKNNKEKCIKNNNYFVFLNTHNQRTEDITKSTAHAVGISNSCREKFSEEMKQRNK